jgi:hypothetical protein
MRVWLGRPLIARVLIERIRKLSPAFDADETTGLGAIHVSHLIHYAAMGALRRGLGLNSSLSWRVGQGGLHTGLPFRLGGEDGARDTVHEVNTMDLPDHRVKGLRGGHGRPVSFHLS